MTRSKNLTTISMLALALAATAPAALAQSAATMPSGTTTASPSATTAGSDMNRVNWDEQNRYWQQNYLSRPYYTKGSDYSAYEPAYHYGADTYNRYGGEHSFNDIDDADLRAGWNKARGNSTMDWDQAKDVSRDAYNRLYDNRQSNIGSSSSGSMSDRDMTPAAGSSDSMGAAIGTTPRSPANIGAGASTSGAGTGASSSGSSQ